MMNVITQNNELTKFAQSLKNEQFITVDTEFSREKTYYPHLSLIQVSGSTQSAIIDVLSSDLDLSDLMNIFNDDTIIKVFHSAKQDLEIIYKLQGKLPSNIFDTQIAASVCGLGDSISYEQLVKSLLNIQLDKSYRNSNWIVRPLSPKQLKYALDDVIYLRNIYIKLLNNMQKLNRTDWIKEELEKLTNITNYQTNTEEVWKKIKFSSYSKEYTYLVKEIAKWRELKSQNLNIPRTHFFSDFSLLTIATSKPQNLLELSKLRYNLSFNNEDANELLSIINNALLDKDSIAKIDLKHNITSPHLTDNSIISLLKILLKHKSEKHQVAEKLISSSQDLYQLVTTYNKKQPIENVKFMSGWRLEIFGQDALRLIQGKIALSIKNQKFFIIERDI